MGSVRVRHRLLHKVRFENPVEKYASMVGHLSFVQTIFKFLIILVEI